MAAKEGQSQMLQVGLTKVLTVGVIGLYGDVTQDARRQSRQCTDGYGTCHRDAGIVMGTGLRSDWSLAARRVRSDRLIKK